MKSVKYLFFFTVFILFTNLNAELIVNSIEPPPGVVNLDESEIQDFLFSGYDDDGDSLSFSWELDSLTVSLDSTYSFATDYNSAGFYELSLTVSDSLVGRTETFFSWEINVFDVDQMIETDTLIPAEGIVNISETDSVQFIFSGYDPDGNPLSYSWEVDSIEVSIDSTYTFNTDYESSGQYEISLQVSDGYSRSDIVFSWLLNVMDLDRLIVVDSLYPSQNSLTIAENDSIQFYFSGFDPDGNIINFNWLLDSLLISTDSSYTFLTDYNSAGTYLMELTVSDGFSRNDTTFNWIIDVTDVDQEIILDSLYPSPGPLIINEFEELEFSFSGIDPDGASLNYNWLLDSVQVATDSIYIFETDEVSAGIYELTLQVNDGFSTRNQLEYSWEITVNNTQLLLVPEYFLTLQEAIDASVDGDTVLVNTGIYPENISFNGKRISVTSYYEVSRDQALIDSTIIDGSGVGPVVTFNSGEDSTAVLQGFTIRDGSAANGGGILIENSDPVLKNLRIIGNTALTRGGGIYGFNSAAKVYQCFIDSNLAIFGAGAAFKNSDASIINCEISNNSASFIGGGLEAYNSSLMIYNNVIRNNFCSELNGGAVAGYNNSVLEINHTTLNANAANSGGGIALNNSSLILRNSIISNNLNYGLYCENSSLDVSYSNFWNNSTADFYNCGDSIGVTNTENANGDPCDAFQNILLDPLFNSALNNDLTLSDLSLCIGAGDSQNILTYDKNLAERPLPSGSEPDLGAFEHILGKPYDAPPLVTQKFPLADTLNIMETDSLNFMASAYDPNGREIYFSWQLDSLEVANDSTFNYYTDYFSSGSYELLLTITDSTSFTREETSLNWIINVADVDREIIVNALEPVPGDTTIIESDSLNFIFSGYDPDLNSLVYSWQVDSVEVAVDSSFSFITDFTSDGIYQITLTVTDGFESRNSLFYEWTVTVSNVTTFYVPALVTTIQAAINAAVNGDTILVSPGQYLENIDFLGKAIIVGSEYFTTGDTAYISQTIIDGSAQSNKSLITFTSGESATSLLSGFKLINGSGYNGTGGGIRCEATSPTLTNLIISENSSYTGGGIYCSQGAAPQIRDCIFSNNIAFEGGGIHCRSNAAPILSNCLIISNNGLNRAGAVDLRNASPNFIHCTITANNSNTAAGFYLNDNSQPQMSNSIVWNNLSNNINVADSLSNFSISYSIIENGWMGIGNMPIDPLFNDAENNDFTCSDYSYTIGSGNISGSIDHDLTGAERPSPVGSNPDLGCYENILAAPLDGPIITTELVPGPGAIELDETDSLEFYIKAYDLNGADLEYSWLLDFEEVSIDSNFIFRTDFESAGDYFLLLTVTDNYSFREERSQTVFTWTITVIDIQPLEIPENIVITITQDSVMICWDPVPDAETYKIYSSVYSDGNFELDFSGQLEGNCWVSPANNEKRFYRVTAEK